MIGSESIQNKIAQVFTLDSTSFEIGNIYVYLNGPYGNVSSSVIEAELYLCDVDGIPSQLLATSELAGSNVDLSGWYPLEFNFEVVAPEGKLFALVLTSKGMDENNYCSWGYTIESNSLSSLVGSYGTWSETPGIARLIRVCSKFDIFDLNNYKIDSISSSVINSTNNNSETTATYDGTDETNGEVSLKQKELLLSVILDSSGSMGWNDRYGNRIDLVKELVSKLSNKYGANVLYDLIKFGAMELDIDTFLSNIDSKVSTINIDLASPDRTSYLFSVVGLATAIDGAEYTIGENTYTVIAGGESKATIVLIGESDPDTTEGQLVKISGSGDDTITYASYTKSVIADRIIAYGFKNLKNRTYTIGNIAIDGIALDSASATNFNLFHTPYSSPQVTEGTNGPFGTNAVDLEASIDTIARKTLETIGVETFNLKDKLVSGSSTANIGSGGSTLFGVYDFVCGDIASTNHTILTQSDDAVSFSPNAKYDIEKNAEYGGIIQASRGDAMPLVGTTLNLLVKDGYGDPIVFFLQTANGLPIEWDITPFQDWVYNNLYWLGEGAAISFSLFDVDGDPFPDGTKVDMYVDFVGTETSLTKTLTKDAFMGEDKIYLSDVDGLAIDMLLDIKDKNDLLQTVSIYEIGEDIDGKYVITYEVLEYSFLVANRSVFIPKQVSAEDNENSDKNESNICLPVVNVTPIVTKTDINPALLKSYDLEQIPSNTPYSEIDALKYTLNGKIKNVPSINGVAAIRFLPITEDVFVDSTRKENELQKILRGEVPTKYPSQLEEATANLEPVEEPVVSPIVNTNDSKDYMVETPVYSANGIVKTTFSSFAEEFESKLFEGVVIPQVVNPIIPYKSYSVTPVVTTVANNESSTGKLVLDPFELFFIPPVLIHSNFGDNEVYYWELIDTYNPSLATPSLTSLIQPYYNKNFYFGGYATGEAISIQYVLSEKLNLARNATLSIKIYENRVGNLEEMSNLIEPIRIEGEASSKEYIPQSKMFINVKNKSNKINEWRAAVSENTTPKTSSDSFDYYGNSSEWVISQQYEDITSIAIVNGTGQLEIPPADKPCMLFVEASISFGNDVYECIHGSFVFMSNPIVINLIEPINGRTTPDALSFDKFISVGWMGATPIEDGTAVVMSTLYQTKIEPSAGITSNGVASGFRLTPIPTRQRTEDVSGETISKERYNIQITSATGISNRATRTIYWLPILEETAKFNFFVKATTTNKEVWADSESSFQIGIDLKSADNMSVSESNDFEVPKVWVGKYGADRLLGLEQKDNSIQKMLISSIEPMGLPVYKNWAESVFLQPDGMNVNIGEDYYQWLTIKTQYGFSANGQKYINYGDISTSDPILLDEAEYQLAIRESEVQFSDGDAIRVKKTAAGAYSYTVPTRLVKEPLSIEIELEEYDREIVADGVDTGVIVATIRWKNDLIKPKFTFNKGTSNETQVDFPLPTVYFSAGQCISKNLSDDGEIYDPRGKADSCIKMKTLDDVKLDKYSVQASISRTDIHDDGLGNSHTHECVVDEDGNGATIRTIVLSGTVLDHTHSISDFTPDGEHFGLRCVAVCTLLPTVTTDIAINATAIYDPTNCDPLPKFNDAKIPYQNRKVFDTLYLLDTLGQIATKPRLVIEASIGPNLSTHSQLPNNSTVITLTSGTTVSGKSILQFYSAKAPSEIIKGFDLQAKAYYTEYVNSLGVKIPQTPVPDGSRIIFEVNVSGITQDQLLAQKQNEKRKLLHVNVNASVSLAGEFAFDSKEFQIVSLDPWLPSTKSLTPSVTNDAIDISNALAKIGYWGSSQVFDALTLAAERAMEFDNDNPTLDYKHIIVLATDGDENTSASSLSQALESIDLVKDDVPVVCIKLGSRSSFDSAILNKIVTNTDGFTASMNNYDAGQIKAVSDFILVNDKFTPNSGLYSNEIDFEKDVRVESFNLEGLSVPVGAGGKYRIRIGEDGKQWGAWSDWANLTATFSINKMARHLNYEITLSGNSNFESPVVAAEPRLKYRKSKETVVYFKDVYLDIKDNQYVSAIHITHQGNIPETSEVVYGVSNSTGTKDTDYYGPARGWISPDKFSILLSRIDEVMETEDYICYHPQTGGWPLEAEVTVKGYSINSPSGFVVPENEYIKNAELGTIQFLSPRKSEEFFTISINLGSSFKVMCKITNFGEEAASLDHVGLIYSIGQRTT